MSCHPLRSDVDVVGSFESSSPLLNRIHALDVATAEANMMSVCAPISKANLRSKVIAHTANVSDMAAMLL